jgi:hypothetical protein
MAFYLLTPSCLAPLFPHRLLLLLLLLLCVGVGVGVWVRVFVCSWMFVDVRGWVWWAWMKEKRRI